MDDAGAALVRGKIGDGAMAQTDTDSALRRRRRHRLGQVAPGPAVRAGGGQHPDTGARARMRPDCRDCRAAGTSADRFHPRWRAGHAAGFWARGGFRVMGIITWSSRCQIARYMLMRNAPRPQGNGCSRRRSPVGQSADPRSRLTGRHTARRCCMTTCPEPWLGPLGFTRPACDSREIWRFKFPGSDSRLVLAP